MKAHLTFKPTELQQKVMKEEIDRQLKENMEKRENEFDAMVMFVLSRHFGFGKVRLRKFHESFLEERAKFYEEFENDYSFGQMCIMELLKKGVDVEQWNSEE